MDTINVSSNSDENPSSSVLRGGGGGRTLSQSQQHDVKDVLDKNTATTVRASVLTISESVSELDWLAD